MLEYMSWLLLYCPRTTRIGAANSNSIPERYSSTLEPLSALCFHPRALVSAAITPRTSSADNCHLYHNEVTARFNPVRKALQRGISSLCFVGTGMKESILNQQVAVVELYCGVVKSKHDVSTTQE